jgi:integrase/recombinase XerD
LKHLNNEELFQLYDSDLVLRLRNAKNLSDTRKLLSRFKCHLNGFPPSPELAKASLAQYVDRKPRTLYRYAQMVKGFMKWYGEPLDDFKVKVPRTLPPYTKDSDIEKLYAAIENKRSHKSSIVRDLMLTELALKTGMRRGELANLEVKDVHADFLVVRGGKGNKDRVIPLGTNISQRLQNFIWGKVPDEKLFGLKAPCVSNKIRQFARKAGLEDFHTHTMRHKFATDLLERGANIKVVQELLGHENLATTEVYLSVTNQSLKDAVNLLDKKAFRVTPKKRTRKEEVDTLMKSIKALDEIIRRRELSKRNTTSNRKPIRGSYALGDVME